MSSDPDHVNPLEAPHFPSSLNVQLRSVISSRIDLISEHQRSYFDSLSSKPSPRHPSTRRALLDLDKAKQNLLDFYAAVSYSKYEKQKGIFNDKELEQKEQRTITTTTSTRQRHSMIRNMKRDDEDLDAWMTRTTFKDLQREKRRNMRIIQLYRIRSVIIMRRLKKWASKTTPVDSNEVRKFRRDLKTGFPVKEKRQWKKRQTQGEESISSSSSLSLIHI